jgi:SynChlorMet cassette radical SAM/SPASM protein ScmF
MGKKRSDATIYDEQATVPPSLNQLYFYLTAGCNLACRHCWVEPGYDPSGDKYPYLPLEFFKTAILEAKPLGLSGVKLTGGEPLLHPQILDLLKIIRQENLSLYIETNGILCGSEIAAEIAKSSDRAVSVSIDGTDADTHEWIRGVPGSFEKAKQAVRNLVDNSTPPQIIMTLMRHNVNQLEDMVRMAEQLGASSVKFNILQPSARGKKLFDTGEALSVENLLCLQRRVETDIAPNSNIDIFFSVPLAFKSFSSILKGKSCVCNILNILGVLASGHYALCGIGTSVQDLVFGRVGENRLDRVWKESIVLKSIRSGLPNRLNGICERCMVKEICMGSCIAQNYYDSGNLWAPNWFCDTAARAGIFPGTRLKR